MIRYETLMLAKTELTNEEYSMLEKSIEKLVATAKGSFSGFDKWGKIRLAYPVKKSDYGIYILARYEIPAGELEAFSKELLQFFRIKCNELVMRHVNVRLAKDATSLYKRPDSVDHASGSSNLDSFLKENKMDKILPGMNNESGRSDVMIEEDYDDAQA
jgi:ribosomal protein S6